METGSGTGTGRTRRAGMMKGPVAGMTVLVLLSLALFFPSPEGFWMYDDPALLRQVVERGPGKYMFVPEVWRLLSAGNFTPWLLLTFNLDWVLFGLRPLGFYIHQLISICVLGCASYVVLRRWFSPGACLMGMSLFLISPPLALSGRLLMERHYIEGLVFALASLHFYMEAGKSKGLAYGLAGSFFYLLSAAAKEVYVPLPFLLPLLSRDPWRRRLADALPWFAVFLLYMGWRGYMLGRLTGGYGIVLAWPQDYLLFPARVAAGMGGGVGAAWWTWLILTSTAAVIAFIAKTERRKLIAVLVFSGAIVAPVVPVSPIMAPRYVLLLLFGWIVLHMIVWDGLKRTDGRAPRYIGLAWWGVLVCGFLYMSHQGGLKDDVVRRQTAEGKFVLMSGAGTDLLVDPVSSGWYYSELSWLREHVLHLPPGPSVLGDYRILCFGRKAPEEGNGPALDRFRTVVRFDAGRGGLTHENADAYAGRVCGGEAGRAIRAEAPLSLSLDHRDSTVSWMLGPYRAGEYAIFLGRSSESVFPLPREGKRHVSFRGQQVFLRVRYISPEGWITYSPLLSMQVDDDDRGNLVWVRDLPR